MDRHKRSAISNLLMLPPFSLPPPFFMIVAGGQVYALWLVIFVAVERKQGFTNQIFLDLSHSSGCALR